MTEGDAAIVRSFEAGVSPSVDGTWETLAQDIADLFAADSAVLKRSDREEALDSDLARRVSPRSPTRTARSRSRLLTTERQSLTIFRPLPFAR